MRDIFCLAIDLLPQYLLHCLLNCYSSFLPLNIRFTSWPLGCSHDFPSACETTLNHVAKWTAKITQNSLKCWTNRTHSNALSIFYLYFLDMLASVMCAIWLSLILWSGCWKSQGIYFIRLYICLGFIYSCSTGCNITLENLKIYLPHSTNIYWFRMIKTYNME